MNEKRTRSRIALFGAPLAIALVIGLGAARTPSPDPDGPMWLQASLEGRTLKVMKGDSLIKEYSVAIGHPNHPTPRGTFTIKRLIWNPAWVPPDVKWAAGKRAAAPGASHNPMKTVKIFFQEPDYYIHGTGAVESLGEAASHGCLRMDPDEAGEVALMLMENAGSAKDWDWVKGILHLGEQRAITLATPAPMVVGS